MKVAAYAWLAEARLWKLGKVLSDKAQQISPPVWLGVGGLARYARRLAQTPAQKAETIDARGTFGSTLFQIHLLAGYCTFSL